MKEEKKQLALLMGYLSGIHSALKDLEQRGMNGLDPAMCSLEDAFGVMQEVLLELSSPEAYGLTR